MKLSDFAEAISTRVWESVGKANWRRFEDARDYVRGLGLKSVYQWYEFSPSGKRPNDIPSNPNQIYAMDGWAGYSDWLGAQVAPGHLRQHRQFEEARAFVRGLGLQSRSEGRAYSESSKKPADIPADPQGKYANNGWVVMGDWLGNGNVKNRDYRTFVKARAFVRTLGLKSGHEWSVYCQSGNKPADIPARPGRTYAKDGWAGYGAWLGTGTVAPRLRQYRQFEEARAYVRSLGLKDETEWRKFSKSRTKPDDIPVAANVIYANDGWLGLGDWLGTSRNRIIGWRPFPEARAYVRSLKLQSHREWLDYCYSDKKPNDIPVKPQKVYANDGWTTWGDWLGTGTVAPRLRQYRPYTDARAFVRGLGLKSVAEWSAYCKSGKIPTDIPAHPRQTYLNEGWVGYGDWLGTGAIASFSRKYRSFKEARDFARSLKLKSIAEWLQYCKSGEKPVDIPVHADRTYAQSGWAGMSDWLGTGRKSHVVPWRPFKQARTYVRDLGLRSAKQWRDYCSSGKKPNDIPSNPPKTYGRSDWAGMADWLGYHSEARSMKGTGEAPAPADASP